MGNQTNSKSVKLKGVVQLFKESWFVYRSKPRTLIGIPAITIGLLFLVKALILFWLFYSPQRLYKLWYFPLGIYLICLFLLVWMIPALLLAIKENLGIIASYKKSLRYLLPYIWIYFLLAIIVIGGYGFFIVPGIIFSVWFSLSIYVLIFENERGMNAILRSKQLVSRRWWGVFWRLFSFYFVSLMLLAVVYLISFLILHWVAKYLDRFLVSQTLDAVDSCFNLFIIPFGLVYRAMIYKSLKEIKKDVIFQELPKKAKLKYVLIGILGTMLFFGMMIGLITTSRKATVQAKDARVIADMAQIRSGAVMLYGQEGSYMDLGCDYVMFGIKAVCDDIKGEIESKPIIHTSEDAYCSYIQLNSGKYFCIDSTGAVIETAVNPSLGYCAGRSFICPPETNNTF